MSDVPRTTFSLTLVDCGEPLDGEPHIRLRRLLKHALRTCQLRCIEVREVKPAPDDQQQRAEPNATH